MKTTTLAVAAATVFFSGTMFANINHPHSIHHLHHPKVELSQNQSAKININSASAGQLSNLKGLGPKKAQSIIDDREKNGSFKSVNDLSRVKGIGEKMVVRLNKQNPGRLTIQ